MTTQAPHHDPIVATAGSYYRRTRYIMSAVLVAAGLWFAYDGWIGWPEENRKYTEVSGELETATLTAAREADPDKKAQAEKRAAELAIELKDYKFRGDFHIRLQKILAITLPPLGIALLAWTLYNSRGQYRLDGTTLSVPGHPPIDLDHITRIDKQLWDRKGIARIGYDTGSAAGTLKLDDFVYDAHPTRDIFKRVEAHTLARVEAPADPTESPTQAPD